MATSEDETATGVATDGSAHVSDGRGRAGGSTEDSTKDSTKDSTED